MELESPIRGCAKTNLCRSWSEAFKRLCESSPKDDDRRLYKILSSDEAITRIAVSLNQDAHKPSADTKSEFETRTAAINITPVSHGQYDIEQIKTDALWLSKEVNLSEVAALRIVVLEWQRRPVAKLRSGYTEVERASLEELQATSIARTTTQLDSECSIINTRTDNSGPAHFLSDERRRLRILDEYFLEQKYLFALHELLLGSFFATLDGQVEDLFDFPHESKERTSPQAAIGRQLLRTQRKLENVDNSRQVRNGIEFLQRCVTQLASGSGILKAEGGRGDIEDAWTRTNLQCMIHVMNIMLLHVRSCKRILSSSIVHQWFIFAHEYAFLEEYSPVSLTACHNWSFADHFTVFRRPSGYPTSPSGLCSICLIMYFAIAEVIILPP